jgi:hypothetical protein
LTLHADAAAKPKPVDGLMEMFENFNELEEEFRENKWDEAQEIIVEIEKDYKSMINELKGKTDAKLIHKFGFVIGNFKKTLAKKDPEELEKPYMMLQDLFLDLMESFDYPHAPVLNVLNRWVDESKEYLESDNYHSIEEEMEEIEHFKERALKQVQGGNESLKDFFEKAEKATQLAEGEEKNKEKLEETLKSMDSILRGLMK